VKKLTVAIGVLESAAIFLYGLSIVIRGTIDQSTAGSPLAQFVIYSMFAMALAGCTWGISKNQNWARTPFMVLQIFFVITGYTLLNGTLVIYKVLGVIVAATGILGFIALIRTPQT
jgi:hypothetical protein